MEESTLNEISEQVKATAKLDAIAVGVRAAIQVADHAKSVADQIATTAKLDAISTQVAAILEMLEGRHGELGMIQKVAVMWRVHVWILCTASAFLGGLLTLMIKHQFPAAL